MPEMNIMDFGAVPGRICTEQIQAAFDAADAARGTVVIPAGNWLTGTINIKNASLWLEKGARLTGSGNIDDYPEIGYVHNEMGQVRALLYTLGGEGIQIGGAGTIDLNGDAFFDTGRFNVPDSKVPFSDKQIRECTYCIGARPNQPMFFKDCRRIAVRDVLIVNAPSWTMSFVDCRDVRVLDLTIDNSLNVPNCDGMHFSCCSDIMVRGCNISAGDDCIAFTAVTDWNRPVERAVVSDCVLRSCSKAISIGYMHSTVRDIAVNNCVIYESNRALVIMSNPGTGLVENVMVSNMRLDTRIRGGNWWGNGEPVCIMGTPHDNANYRDALPDRKTGACVRNVLFDHLICTAENALAVIGEEGSVRNVRLSNIAFALKDSENLPLKGRLADLSPGEQAAVLPDDGKPYWLFLKQVEDVRVENAFVEPFHEVRPAALVEGCVNVSCP